MVHVSKPLEHLRKFRANESSPQHGATIPCDRLICQHLICYYELVHWTDMKIKSSVSLTVQFRWGMP